MRISRVGDPNGDRRDTNRQPSRIVAEDDDVAEGCSERAPSASGSASRQREPCSSRIVASGLHRELIRDGSDRRAGVQVSARRSRRRGRLLGRSSPTSQAGGRGDWPFDPRVGLAGVGGRLAGSPRSGGCLEVDAGPNRLPVSLPVGHRKNRRRPTVTATGDVVRVREACRWRCRACRLIGRRRGGGRRRSTTIESGTR